MNRQRVEQVRQDAQRWADYYLNESRATNSPVTPMEAYWLADWNSAIRMIGLCDALLAEESGWVKPEDHWVTFTLRPGSGPLHCWRCGRTLNPDALVRPSDDGFRCYVDERACALVANWSA